MNWKENHTIEYSGHYGTGGKNYEVTVKGYNINGRWSLDLRIIEHISDYDGIGWDYSTRVHFHRSFSDPNLEMIKKRIEQLIKEETSK